MNFIADFSLLFNKARIIYEDDLLHDYVWS